MKQHYVIECCLKLLPKSRAVTHQPFETSQGVLYAHVATMPSKIEEKREEK
jgi:hypothetical protein